MSDQQPLNQQLEKLAKNKSSYNKLLELFKEIKKQSNSKYEVIENITKNINQFLWSLIFEDNKPQLYYTGNIELVTGYNADEVKRMPERNLSLIIDEDLPDVRKALDHFENSISHNKLQLIYRIRKKNGTICWIKENINIERNGDGTVLSYNGCAADITDMKEEEQSLRDSQEKLLQMNNTKDRFISILSHDLRAPFTSILGFAEILLNEKSLPDSERTEYLNYIYEASQTQLQLINYLLDWSRLQTGRLKIEPQRIKVHALVYNCISALTGNAVRKNIKIKTSVNEDLFIQADERLISQVIINLLNNAIKFTEEGKKIDIIIDRYNETHIEFNIKDEGIGIPESHKNKIFKIDDKLSTEGTKGEKGTGFGLSLVKEIVEKHNGSIWFFSEKNKGSEFHFTIPVAYNSVLVIDENKSERELYVKLVKDSLPDFEITEAENGFEAMQILLLKVPSLVIVNHELPLMNGLQLIEAMKKGSSVLKIPVIVIGSNIPDEIVNLYNQSGVDLVFQKPIQINSLSDVLKSIV